MRVGSHPSCGRLGLSAALALSLGVAGCAISPKNLDRALLAKPESVSHCSRCEQGYLILPPDVLDLEIAGHPEWSGPHAVDAEGRVAVAGDSLRIAGQNIAAAKDALQALPALHESEVSLRVAEYRSQQLFLISDVPGQQHAVPYRGPETVVDLLQRAGGISSRSAPGNIEVVRAHVADGGPPQVFQVDLSAILLKQDQRTNVTVQPFDQIYIGQSRQSAFLSCCPPWFQPFYKKLCGMARREKAAEEARGSRSGEPAVAPPSARETNPSLPGPATLSPL